MPGVKRQASPPARRQRAERTRARIVLAAARLFRARGYAATTMDAIAADAKVAVQTVYFTFHTKGELLEAVVDAAIAGDESTTTQRTAWWLQIESEPDAARRFEFMVDAAADVADRLTPLLPELQAAASSDPAMADRVRTRLTERRRFMERVVAATARRGQLRVGLEPGVATDIVFAVAGTELFGLLVGVCGWTVAEWKTWTLGTLRGQVLGLDGPSVPASQET